jgi:hypothetical protein
MHRTMLRLRIRLAIALALIAALAGCQTWQSKMGVPGLSFSQGERQIVKQAKNDPFPSPDQVDMK